jgi:hypothetical protein
VQSLRLLRLELGSDRAFVVFIEAESPLKAMLAYEKALEWRELFEIASRENVSADEITATGYRVAGRISVTLAAPSVSLIS